MPLLELEPTIPVFGREKMFYASDRTATVIGTGFVKTVHTGGKSEGDYWLVMILVSLFACFHFKLISKDRTSLERQLFQLRYFQLIIETPTERF
jgi:hypothetical protein